MTERETQSRAPSKGLLWAIQPERLRAGADAFFLLLETPPAPESYYSVDDDGIATVRVMDAIGRRAGAFSFLGTDSDRIAQDLREIASDPTVRGVFVHMDSPGGMVDGTREVMEALLAVRVPKVVYADGLMASAAYWLGSAADKVYASKTSTVGSIGVVATHVEHSGADAKAGVKYTYVYNGKFKRLVNDAEPLTEEGREYIQEQVDAIYDIFVNDVAFNRAMSADDVRGLESRVYIAEQAEKQGLVDGVMSMEQAYTQLRRSAGIMDLSELKSEFPDLYGEVLEIGRQAVTEDEARQRFPGIIEEAVSAGAEAERKRIAEIREAAFPGQEGRCEELIRQGVAPDEARKALIQDQKARMAQGLKNIEAEDMAVAPNAEPDNGKPVAKNKGQAGDMLDAIAKQHMAEGLDYSQAFDRAKAENPELLKVYIGR